MCQSDLTTALTLLTKFCPNFLCILILVLAAAVSSTHFHPPLATSSRQFWYTSEPMVSINIVADNHPVCGGKEKYNFINSQLRTCLKLFLDQLSLLSKRVCSYRVILEFQRKHGRVATKFICEQNLLSDKQLSCWSCYLQLLCFLQENARP